jgi:hypothetical protein
VIHPATWKSSQVIPKAARCLSSSGTTALLRQITRPRKFSRLPASSTRRADSKSVGWRHRRRHPTSLCTVTNRSYQRFKSARTQGVRSNAMDGRVGGSLTAETDRLPVAATQRLQLRNRLPTQWVDEPPAEGLRAVITKLPWRAWPLTSSIFLPSDLSTRRHHRYQQRLPAVWSHGPSYPAL